MRRKGTVLRESSQNRENAKTGDTQNIQLNTIAEEYHKESKSDRPIEGLDHKSSMHTIEPTSAKKDKLEERGPKPLNIAKQQNIDEVDAYDQDPTADLPSQRGNPQMISVRSGKSIVINDHEKMASNATQNLQKNTDISKINLNSAKLRTVKNKKMTK